MAFPAFDYISPSDYLAIEAQAERKHEYFDGRIYAMSGASFRHNMITSNLSQKIGAYLDGKSCDLFGPDLRITTPLFDSYMYPDLTIICNEAEFQRNGFDTVTNPTAIVEVLSPSTRGYDIAFKSYYYKQIPSLQEYILVDTVMPFVRINKRRNETLWEDTINIENLDSAFTINSIGLQLFLKDIYRKVSFPISNK